jgi:hypothetical protein
LGGGWDMKRSREKREKIKKNEKGERKRENGK